MKPNPDIRKYVRCGFGKHDICPICGHENEKTDSYCNFCEREVLHS